MDFDELKKRLKARSRVLADFGEDVHGYTPFYNEELKGLLGPDAEFPVIQPEECWKTLQKYADGGQKLCLNLGAGGKPSKEPEWLNVDARPMMGIHLCIDMFDLLKWVPKRSVAKILNKDFIEHFSFRDIPALMRLWRDVLLPGSFEPGIDGEGEGYVEITTPSLRLVMKKYVDPNLPDCNWVWLMYHFFGMQSYSYNVHKCLFDFPTIATRLQNEGFSEVQHLPDEGNHLHVRAYK